jgi:hypothetical protein
MAEDKLRTSGRRGAIVEAASSRFEDRGDTRAKVIASID